MECMNVLPAGFRFHPTDEELISDYLKKKISASSNPFVSIIADIDLYKFDPWQLPGKAYFGEKEWFFFSPRDKKYPNGARPNRAAASGYWKATGTDKPILSRSSQCIGVKKALVFYEGRAPTGNKTNWMMYEYRIDNVNYYSMMHRGSMRLDDWVLCRIRQKTVPLLPKPEENIKKKSKRAYHDAFETFMEDEFGQNNISFLQQNEWQPQQHYQESDLRAIVDFTENTSSSQAISYCQMEANGWTNEALVPNQPNKKLSFMDSYALFNNIPLTFHKLPV